MSDIAVENLEKMVNPRRFIDGSERVVLELPSLCVGRGVYQPGWRWSEHAGPQTGENSVRHVGLIESGRMTIRAADRTEATVGPGDIFEVGPGHDAWVIGNEPCVALDFYTCMGATYLIVALSAWCRFGARLQNLRKFEAQPSVVQLPKFLKPGTRNYS